MGDAPRTDVIIAGGGPVGAALALLARDRGVRIRMIGRAPASRAGQDSPIPGDAAAPFRPVALAHASAHLLSSLQALRLEGTTPIARIHVSQQGRFGRTVLDAREHALPALGYVVDGTRLTQTLQERCGGQFVSGNITAWQANDDEIAVEWDDEAGAPQRSRARLLVLADGGEDREPSRDYGQQAIVCTVRSAVPHRGAAYERFTPGGPLALLPHQAGYAVVWSLTTPRAQELLRTTDGLFIRALQEIFGWRQGRLSAPGTRLAFPLYLRRGESMHRRVISIGNAAQTLHPVAGQGFNLGLRDAMALADQLAASSDDVLGSDGFVKQYYQRRLVDRTATIAVTDLLARIFALEVPPAPLLRSAALTALDTMTPARNFFIRRMILGVRGL
jgi:2-octaprenyl-6-methoxyphenol hydroxylase